jgi:hypothetical protein
VNGSLRFLLALGRPSEPPSLSSPSHVLAFVVFDHLRCFSLRELDSLLIRSDICEFSAASLAAVASPGLKTRSRPPLWPKRPGKKSRTITVEDSKRDAAARAYVRQTCHEMKLVTVAVRLHAQDTPPPLHPPYLCLAHTAPAPLCFPVVRPTATR